MNTISSHIYYHISCIEPSIKFFYFDEANRVENIEKHKNEQRVIRSLITPVTLMLTWPKHRLFGSHMHQRFSDIFFYLVVKPLNLNLNSLFVRVKNIFECNIVNFKFFNAMMLKTQYYSTEFLTIYILKISFSITILFLINFISVLNLKTSKSEKVQLWLLQGSIKIISLLSMLLDHLIDVINEMTNSRFMEIINIKDKLNSSF